MRWREDDISRVGEIKLLSILKQLLAIRSIYVMEIFQVDERYRGWLESHTDTLLHIKTR